MKVAFHTLGCKVNQYESEALAEKFKDRGYEIVSENDFADIYIINTCTVTALADRKSRQYIRRMKKKNPDSIVAVTGCYAQIKPEEVAAIEGVNIVTGTNEKAGLVDHVEEYIQNQSKEKNVYVKDFSKLTDYESMGTVTDAENRTRAYIKIQEGCNRFCSYCIIPYARGAVRSRDTEEIVREAQALLDKGYKEIVLTGINTALYGADFSDGDKEELYLDSLLARLDALEGDFRIRLSSLEPTVVNAEYVKKLFGFKHLCHHLHLSLQSGSDDVLAAMNRKYDRAEYMEIVRALKVLDGEYGITTDIIVGFPGESDRDFKDSLEMVKKVGFCKVHPFKYSVRPGTAAAKMPDQISAGTKKQRIDELMDADAQASLEFFAQNAGKVRTVLVEEFLEDKEMYTGYTDNYIKVYLQGPGIETNSFHEVRLVKPMEDGDGMFGILT